MVEEKNSYQTTEKLISFLENNETEEAIANLMELLVIANKSGLLDLLKVMANEEVFESLLKYLLNANVLRLADKLDAYAELFDKAGTVLLSEEKERTGIGDLLKALGDPDVQRGLTKAIKLLKLIGSYKEK
ncbi:MAG TPA: DUF1641 domain-containing protein [Fervidicoccus fontis]|uniref:DUF1641 domain-containing protein n=1 Tax=Fervidicoccus fontis TaxID=683846 RepID=A0A7C2ULH9_9CREN|nr:MAG: hypothetical protein C0179_03760 [Fervidicoccus sp.]HEU97889.1 DUF1641 domain-containing protein [Fervidicoccus fontis]